MGEGKIKLRVADHPLITRGKEIQDLLCKVNKTNPRPEDLAAFRKILSEVPDLWRIAGDVAKITADKLIDDISSLALVHESLKRGWIEVGQALGFQTASGLEKLLIEQVLLCWLRLNVMEFQYSEYRKQTLTIDQADFLEKRLNYAQRRFLRACETLARVRRLLRPKVAQVNIAQQQVNIAQGEG